MNEWRAAADAVTSFRCAIAATGVIPDEVTTDGVAAYPSVAHETGRLVQQRIGRDHWYLKGRVCGMPGFKTLTGACLVCRAHAFLRKLRGGFYDLGRRVDAVALPQPPVVRAWAASTGALLRR